MDDVVDGGEGVALSGMSMGDDEKAREGKQTVRFVCDRAIGVACAMACDAGEVDGRRKVLRILLMKVERKGSFIFDV